MNDWITSALTAVACFAMSVGCGYYLFKASGKVRWSRSNKKLVTRHPRPTVFWTKVMIVACGALLSISMGILLLAFHGRKVWRGIEVGKPSLEQLQPD